MWPRENRTNFETLAGLSTSGGYGWRLRVVQARYNFMTCVLYYKENALELQRTLRAMPSVTECELIAVGGE